MGAASQCLSLLLQPCACQVCPPVGSKVPPPLPLLFFATSPPTPNPQRHPPYPPYFCTASAALQICNQTHGHGQPVSYMPVRPLLALMDGRSFPQLVTSLTQSAFPNPQPRTPISSSRPSSPHPPPKFPIRPLPSRAVPIPFDPSISPPQSLTPHPLPYRAHVRLTPPHLHHVQHPRPECIIKTQVVY